MLASSVSGDWDLNSKHPEREELYPQVLQNTFCTKVQKKKVQKVLSQLLELVSCLSVLTRIAHPRRKVL